MLFAVCVYLYLTYILYNIFYKKSTKIFYMEQVTGIEPIYQPWQDRILTIILHLHGISVAISGPARLSLILYRNLFLCWQMEPTTESGAE